MIDGTEVTLVSLYDDEVQNHYVGVVKGILTAEDEDKLAKKFDAVIPNRDTNDMSLSDPDKNPRQIYFNKVLKTMLICKPEDVEKLVLHALN